MNHFCGKFHLFPFIEGGQVKNIYPDIILKVFWGPALVFYVYRLLRRTLVRSVRESSMVNGQ
jgi:hypothetical protein